MIELMHPYRFSDRTPIYAQVLGTLPIPSGIQNPEGWVPKFDAAPSPHPGNNEFGFHGTRKLVYTGAFTTTFYFRVTHETNAVLAAF